MDVESNCVKIGESVSLYAGDCLDVLKGMADCSVDSVVTDPPYGLSFMGKKWDYDVPSEDIWRECLRVLKPGGHLLAFAGTRTQHRMAVRIEDAGFEIREMIAWVYGQGMPKSVNISKEIDREAGAEREVVGEYAWPDGKERNTKEHTTKRNGKCGDIKSDGELNDRSITVPATESAKIWNGWYSGIKPAMEPITVARKPLEASTIAKNVMKYGTGAFNIDGCRIGVDSVQQETHQTSGQALGRFPANFIHDGSQMVLDLFPDTKSGKPMNKVIVDVERNVASGGSKGGEYFHSGFGDSGSAARYFYCAKATKFDREEGLEGLPDRVLGMSGGASAAIERGEEYDNGDSGMNQTKIRKNNHPTVKPTELMRYLCRLVTPPNGIVLDPFMGSGSTGKAAVMEGFGFIGIDREVDYVTIATARIKQKTTEKESV